MRFELGGSLGVRSLFLTVGTTETAVRGATPTSDAPPEALAVSGAERASDTNPGENSQGTEGREGEVASVSTSEMVETPCLQASPWGW